MLWSINMCPGLCNILSCIISCGNSLKNATLQVIRPFRKTLGISFFSPTTKKSPSIEVHHTLSPLPPLRPPGG